MNRGMTKHRILTFSRMVLASWLLMLLSVSVAGHPGGLDSQGGHNNRKSGGYHYHSFSRSNDSAPRSAFRPQRDRNHVRVRSLPRTGYRSKPRETYSGGRLTAHSTNTTNDQARRESFVSAISTNTTVDPEKADVIFGYAKRQLAAKKRTVALKYLRTLVNNYKDTPSAAAAAKLLKTLASNEPYRLWKDRSGKHSMEARATGCEENTVYLQRRDGKTLTVAVESLSRDDYRYLIYLYGNTG